MVGTARHGEATETQKGQPRLEPCCVISHSDGVSALHKGHTVVIFIDLNHLKEHFFGAILKYFDISLLLTYVATCHVMSTPTSVDPIVLISQEHDIHCPYLFSCIYLNPN